MNKLLSISYTLIVVSMMFAVHVGDASAQKAANISKGVTGPVVERRGANAGSDGPIFESIFTFSSTELRQISGRYAAEGSNVHVYAMHEHWDKINARVESQRSRILIP